MKRYFLPISFMIVMAVATWYFFIWKNWITNDELRLTSIIAVLGISLAIFQFWVSELNTNFRNKSQIRYNEYRQIFALIEAVPDKLNEEMMNGQEVNPHTLVSSMANLANRIISFLNSNDYLFPNLKDCKESKDLNDILAGIVKRTDQLRLEIEEINKKHEELPKLFLSMQERANWHNEMSNQLNALHKAKYKFYEKLCKAI